MSPEGARRDLIREFITAYASTRCALELANWVRSCSIFSSPTSRFFRMRSRERIASALALVGQPAHEHAAVGVASCVTLTNVISCLVLSQLT
jgi:hypothetical protein